MMKMHLGSFGCQNLIKVTFWGGKKNPSALMKVCSHILSWAGVKQG